MDRAKEAIDEGQNQYSRPAGDISLVNAISEV